MATIDDGGAAFPFAATDPSNVGLQTGGMSLRDRIALEALGGMLAHSTRYKPREIDRALHWHDAIAKEAYELADAMLAARKATGEQP